MKNRELQPLLVMVQSSGECRGSRQFKGKGRECVGSSQFKGKGRECRGSRKFIGRERLKPVEG